MVNTGDKITALRKLKKWSQGDLAEAIGASRDIIGKYERGDNSPSIEMALKLAKVFEVPLDYLIGDGKYADYNKDTIKRLEDIEDLDSDTKNLLFTVIDTFLRDYKTRQAYA